MKRTRIVVGIVLAAVLAGLLGCAQPNQSASPSPSRQVAEQGSALPSAEKPDSLALGEQAKLLTAHLLEGAFGGESLGWKSALDKRELDNFVLSAARYCANPDYLYYGAVKSQDGEYEFPVAELSRMLYEVFGVENWTPQTDNLVFDEQTQAYHSGLEFGFGGSFSFEDISAMHYPLTGTVETSFRLTDKAGFRGEPGWQEHGDYTITFAVMQGNEREFLRFIQMKSRKLENAT